MSLSHLRNKSAKLLEQKVSEELKPLKMENTKFAVEFVSLPEEAWSRNGIDKIIFLVSTNPGTPFSPLTKIASGGELSRFMLAMKVVLSSVKSVPTIIFDEIDTGIGGAVADAVGKRLELLGHKLQVIVITHQPQVAARGNYHLRVYKTHSNDITTTSVDLLDNKQRQEEIARMLAGSKVTDEARKAAEKLMA